MSITVKVSGATVTCDTPGCDSALTVPGVYSFRAMELIAVEYHWLSDPQSCGGARRCPRCADRGWPWCMPANGAASDLGLYLNLPQVFAWCERNVWPIVAAPEPDVVAPGVVLSPAQEAAMTRLEEVWDEHEITVELPVILSED